MKLAPVMVLLFGMACLLASGPAMSNDYPVADVQKSILTIYSTTDTVIFEPVLKDFQALNPDIAVHYELLDGMPLYLRFLNELARSRPRADLLLSSSMDLQVKLVNDGYAAPHQSVNSNALPAWARWRNEAFGFTFEPAVMVFNRKSMAGQVLPRSRAQLLQMLKRNPQQWRGKVGTYDIGKSSVGYLLASQDARQSSEFGALLETFGDANVRVEENTSTLLDQLESGELAIGYNLLGSYTRRRIEEGAPLTIVYPQDYTLAVSRTAVLPASAPNPQAAHRFLEYLLSLRGQRVLATQGHLSAIRTEIKDPYSQRGLADTQVGPVRPIVLGPGLLVFLDKVKRRKLLESWHGTVRQETK